MIQNDFTESEIRHINVVKSNLINELKKKFNEINFPFITSQMFLTGGAIATGLQGRSPNDYDIYCKNDEMLKSLVTEYTVHTDCVADVSENYREYLGKNGKMITEHAITMQNKIQFITNKFGSPDEIRNTFDFVHCKPYLDFDTGKLYISKQQYDACTLKQLIVNNPKTVTARRQQKFIERGYGV